jgi:hypothetical protein
VHSGFLYKQINMMPTGTYKRTRFTAEHCAAKKGKIHRSPEDSAKIGATRKGKKAPDEFAPIRC